MNISRKAYLQEISLPEFDKSRKIDGADVYVFNSDCQHDIIIGRDILQKIGFIINFAENKMVWLDQEVQIKPAYYWENPMSSHIVLDNDNGFESYAARILDAKYEQMKLKSVLDNYGTLFDDPLGHSIQMLSQFMQSHIRYHMFIGLPSKRSWIIFVTLECCDAPRPTQWASLTFITPKKDGRVR